LLLIKSISCPSFLTVFLAKRAPKRLVDGLKLLAVLFAALELTVFELI
jgi:hypothetical protein